MKALKFAALVVVSILIVLAYRQEIIPATPAGDLVFMMASSLLVCAVAMLGGGFTSTFMDWVRRRR